MRAVRRLVNLTTHANRSGDILSCSPWQPLDIIAPDLRPSFRFVRFPSLLSHFVASATYTPLGTTSYTDPSLEAHSLPNPLPSYDELRRAVPKQHDESLPHPYLPPRAGYLLRSFRRSAKMKDRALLTLSVSNDLFATASLEFQQVLRACLNPETAHRLAGLPDEAAHSALFTRFTEFVVHRHGADVEAYRKMSKTLDLRRPHLWYPTARALRRRVVYHAGATNSGKTHAALSAMRAASSGIYAGPLRLLALEVYERCNAEGTYCSLVTGQEERKVPGAQHIACTVEMVGLSTPVDVCVIDEIQMIADEARGFAWTRALLGVPATEIHLCGDASALDLVRWLCDEMEEELEVKTYERFTPLHVDKKGVQRGGYAAVQPGDCIVAFSRQDIYSIKSIVESTTSHKTSVIYGALPPETRRQQAWLFNQGQNEIMVASDAVGMGLNLNIRRVIFHSLIKRESSIKGMVPVHPSAVKQIAGRAGRRGSKWEQGLVTCFNIAYVSKLQKLLEAPLPPTETLRAGLSPELEHFEAFAAQHPGQTFLKVLSAFAEMAVLQGRFFFCRQESTEDTARILQQISGLSFRDGYVFAIAPVAHTDLYQVAALLHFAKRYAAGIPCMLHLTLPDRVPCTPDQMRALETAHAVASLWLWLSSRFDEESFPNREATLVLIDRICELLAGGLDAITAKNMEMDSDDIMAKGDARNRREGRRSRLHAGAGQPREGAAWSKEGVFSAFAEDLRGLKKKKSKTRSSSDVEERQAIHGTKEAIVEAAALYA